LDSDEDPIAETWSVEVFEAIIRTMPHGSVGYENAVDAEGRRVIWLDKPVVDRLGGMRGPGESYATLSSAWRKGTVARNSRLEPRRTSFL
jgi:hypothetical protein